MKKRRLTALVLAVVMALTACSKGDSGKQTSEPSTERTFAEETSAQTGTAQETQESQETQAAQEKHEYRLPEYAFTEESFPRMDGSTATIPVGKLLAKLLLGADDTLAESLSRFNRTTQSFRNLKNGLADILIVGQPNASVFTEMDEDKFEYEIEEIATDALIFVVNESNPVDDLTTDQIRDIYSGRITNWKEVGGNDEPIAAFQRNEGAGSQALMVKLIMGDTAFAEAPSGFIIGSMGELMSAVRSYDNSANAIGYSVYYYANDMKMAKGLKIISVDGVEPNADTIRGRKYPHLNAYYSVIPTNPATETATEKARAEGARAIYEWLVTDDGQQMMADLGYVSIKDLDTAGSAAVPEAKYTRLSEEPMEELQARNDYGTIYPYHGEAVYSQDEYVGYLSGYYSGFFDAKGRLVTDPVYSEIGMVEYYTPQAYTANLLPIWYMVTTTEDEAKKAESEYPGEYVTQRYRFATLDGSFVSDEYNHIQGTAIGPLCYNSYEDPEFTLYDISGGKILDLQMLIDANGGESFRSRIYDESASLIEYGEGYYLYTLADGYWFLDEKTLKPVYGPYVFADAFYGGIARVYKDHGETSVVNYIDTDGKPLLETWADQVDTLDDGRLIVAMWSDEMHVFERESGREIFSVPDVNYFTKEEYGVVVYPKTDDDNYWAFDVYDFDGKLLCSNRDRNCYLDVIHPIMTISTADTEAETSDSTDNQGSQGVQESGEKRGTWAKNILTGKEVFFEDIDGIYTLSEINQTPVVRYMYGTGYDHDSGNYEIKRTVVIDEDLNVTEESKNYIYLVANRMKDEHYIVSQDVNTGVRIYHDSDTYEPICTWTREGYIYGDLYLADTENACEVYDFRTGELRLCYPRIGDLED